MRPFLIGISSRLLDWNLLLPSNSRRVTFVSVPPSCSFGRNSASKLYHWLSSATIYSQLLQHRASCLQVPGGTSAGEGGGRAAAAGRLLGVRGRRLARCHARVWEGGGVSARSATTTTPLFRTATATHKSFDSPFIPHGRPAANPVTLVAVLDSGAGLIWRASTSASRGTAKVLF